jgi:predicted nucleic acid-binding protein
MSGWLIETNIVSELMRDRPSAAVLAWLDGEVQHHLFISSVTVMEIRHGLARLPEGHRKRQLDAAFADVLAEDFPGRILAFDEYAAALAGRLKAAREVVGRPVDFRDTMIAGIALANRTGIVTRNAGDFHGLDVPVVNPFDG